MTQATFRYQNPIYNNAFETIRDAQITVVDGVYYLTGTSPIVEPSELIERGHDPSSPIRWKLLYGEGSSPGVKLYSSRNLLDWRAEGLLMDRRQIDDKAWYKDCFWAPEIHHSHGRFYLTFTAKNVARKTAWGMGLCVADTITGPYRLLTPKEPLIGGGIDLSLFTDDDGRTYAFCVRKGIRVAEVDLNKPAVVSDYMLCTEMAPGTWEDRVMEGPYCIKRQGIYYLFYSCGARGYEVGYATATNIFGPWTKALNNPLFGVQNKEACDKMGIPFTGDPNHPLLFAGHNSIFTGPDGRDWTSYLIMAKGQNEQLGIDPIWIEDGIVRTNAPTYTPQTVPLARGE